MGKCAKNQTMTYEKIDFVGADWEMKSLLQGRFINYPTSGP